MFRPLLLCLLAFASTHASAQESLPNESVPRLDLQRYSGQWHEIAHLPMFFQRNCTANITATYALQDDGMVSVRNACDEEDGERSVSEGVARAVLGHPGRLEVRFAPDWIGWLPMVWADYWVIELDEDYRWAVVGGPDRKYLWVLSRTPTMSRDQFDAIRDRAARRGYPVERLVLPAGTLD